MSRLILITLALIGGWLVTDFSDTISTWSLRWMVFEIRDEE